MLNVISRHTEEHGLSVLQLYRLPAESVWSLSPLSTGRLQVLELHRAVLTLAYIENVTGRTAVLVTDIVQMSVGYMYELMSGCSSIHTLPTKCG
jgi:hypothetical protein